jgi:hypothetical protein
LKLGHEKLLSNFAFKFILRRYSEESQKSFVQVNWLLSDGQGLTLITFSAQLERIYRIGGARMGCVARVKGVLGGV